MSKKSNYIYYILLFLIFSILTIYLNPNFDFSINSLKHWSTYHRDDIVFVYGTLIYNEGYDQHHLDHPSLFTFIFSSFFYKIFYFFDFLDHYTLSGFIESKNINFSLSKLFFVSKITILFFSILTVLILYKIFTLLTFNQFNSFLLSFLKMKKWYNRDEFHKANYKEAFEPYKDLAISEETLLEVLPTPEKSDAFFNEFTMLVDCENPKDIKF